MNHSKNVKQLQKLLVYMLGKRPDEFGLVPDSEGFVKIRELQKALNEEEGFRGVKEPGINEAIIQSETGIFEKSDDSVRVADRNGIIKFDNQEIPKVLYYAAKRKTYAHIREKGIMPKHGDSYVILASEPEMAMKTGKRSDSDPVAVSIQTGIAIRGGVDINRKGELLFISRFIPPECIFGPPVEKILGDQNKKEYKKTVQKAENFTPGSFHLNYSEEKEGWKNSKKRLRREKKTMWPDE